MNTKRKEKAQISSTVHRLDTTVVDQIAAGEVVERPASVVKELVENALDAGAGEIKVILDNGGRSNIEVIDDGHGMSPVDAELAVERFATSKISNVDDLLSIGTLGFRGEALSSIASVSRFTLATRRSDSDNESGTEIKIEGGQKSEVLQVAMPRGTRIQVKNLFFNVPARRKFLRSERSETGLVRVLLTDFSLAYPEVRFSLVANGVELISFAPMDDFFLRARQINVAGKQPVVVDETFAAGEETMHVMATLSQPVASLSSATRLRLIVNGRTVRDKILLRAVRGGYGNFLKAGKYPSGILMLEMPPGEVDVNVHPQKTEVRFRSPDFVISRITNAIQRALSGIEPEMGGGGEDLVDLFPSQHRYRSSGPVAFSAGAQTSGNREFAFTEKGEGASSLALYSASSGALEAPEPDASQRLSEMRYLAQIFHCYLLMEGRSRFAIVDMHAAHERVVFYKLKKAFVEGKVASQQLLVSEVVELPADQRVQFEAFQNVLKKVGFECELFGDDAISVSAVPAVLAKVNPKLLFDELFALPEGSNWESMLEGSIDAVITRIACHGSVRSGRDLEREEVYELLHSLEAAEASSFCPHGRPVVKLYSQYAIESMFGRIQ